MASPKTNPLIVKQAEELYKLIGIPLVEEVETPAYDPLTVLPIEKDKYSGKEIEEKLHWTRLSINSNFGCIVD